MKNKSDSEAILREIGRSFDKYTDLYKMVTERYRARLVEADPRLPRDQAFHLAHNWGNEASRQILSRYHRVAGYVSGRQLREYRRLYEILKQEVSR